MLDSSELTIFDCWNDCCGAGLRRVFRGAGDWRGKTVQGTDVRLGFHFGLFQALMPIIGWGIGSGAVRWVREWDHWLASGIVLLIAVHTLVEAMRLTGTPKIDFSVGGI